MYGNLLQDPKKIIYIYIYIKYILCSF